jgi:2-octaprenyl-6-methoxyphenol hydroxylase
MIDRKDYDLPALGYVSRYGHLVSALAPCARRRASSRCALPRTDAGRRADAVTLILDSEGAPKTLRAGIVVQAEGGLFNEQQTRATTATTGKPPSSRRCAAAPPPHRAYERFTEQGPLALLPQDDEYSLVWCVRPETANTLQALNDAAFLQAGRSIRRTRGPFHARHAAPGLPLGLNADPRSTARTVAIGNAAQTLHPVAGQGLNLGLRDVTVLARLLAQGATGPCWRSSPARQRDRSTTVRITDTMARIFANDSPAQAVLGLAGRHRHHQPRPQPAGRTDDVRPPLTHA